MLAYGQSSPFWYTPVNEVKKVPLVSEGVNRHRIRQLSYRMDWLNLL